MKREILKKEKRSERECSRKESVTVSQKGSTMPDLADLQLEVKEWQDKEFPKQEAWEPLIGIQEELGELAHAHLKQHQKIRGSPAELEEKARDAVGDMVIYIAGYCNARGFNLPMCVNQAWNVVKQRNRKTWGGEG